jgi:DNA-binding NtrC family response regulator
MMLREARRRFETDFFRQLLQSCRWHVPTVAKKAGIDESHCYKKLDQLGLIRRKDATCA